MKNEYVDKLKKLYVMVVKAWVGIFWSTSRLCSNLLQPLTITISILYRQTFKNSWFLL